LKEVFGYIKSKYESKKTLVITWDHGSVFGINMDRGFESTKKNELIEYRNSKLFKCVNQEVWTGNFLSNISDSNKLSDKKLKYELEKNRKKRIKLNKEKLERERLKERKLGLYNKKLFKKNTKIVDLLTNDELGYAITEGFGKNEVDVLIMLNCIMQNIFTCFSLKDCVHYLVAPQTLIVEPGYNFERIAKMLNREELIDGRLVAEFAIESMKDKYTECNYQSYYETQATFAIDLKLYDNFICKFNRYTDLVTQLIERLRKSDDKKKADKILSAIQDSSNHCFDHDGLDLSYSMCDLIGWLDFLENLKIHPIFKRMKDELKLLYSTNGLIVKSAIGNRIYGDSKCWENKKKIEPSGLSIYIPTLKPLPAYQTDVGFILFNAKYRPIFLRDTNWMNFLNAVWQIE
jgi:hypothetical protein